MSASENQKTFTLFPAIDISGGRVVRLSQGRADQETVYFEDPLEPAHRWRKAGCTHLHVVDLDGAFRGEPQNHAVLEQLAALGFFLELGGGIRTEADIARVLERGVARVVLGTAALEDEAFLKNALQKYGAKIAVGIDAKDGKVATRGWVDVSEKTVETFAGEMVALGVQTLIYTDIATDGMLTGPNLQAQDAMARLLPPEVSLVASGGVSAVEDLQNLHAVFSRHQNPDAVIIGRALYEGRFTMEEALRSVGS